MTRRALARQRVTEAVCADAAETGLAAGSFDLAMASNVLHLHPCPERVLDEALRLVRPGGAMVCVWPAENLGFSRALVEDVQAGRGLLGALGACALRLAVGVPGVLLGARSWSGAEVGERVHVWMARHADVLLANEGEVRGVSAYAVMSVGKERA